MKSTPPVEFCTAATTFGAVCPTCVATKSPRDTSLKIIGSSKSFGRLRGGFSPASSAFFFNFSRASFLSAFLVSAGMVTTPIFVNISPTMRATTVLPVPGFPRKRMWKDWPLSLLRPKLSLHALSFTSPKSWPSDSFTLASPTNLFNLARTGCKFSSSFIKETMLYCGAGGLSGTPLNVSNACRQSRCSILSTTIFHWASVITCKACLAIFSKWPMLMRCSLQEDNRDSVVLDAATIATSSPSICLKSVLAVAQSCFHVCPLPLSSLAHTASTLYSSSILLIPPPGPYCFKYSALASLCF
mmetsp:Transcript_128349/g.273680  ORF Transcript_128349/g.273680 Transcript_128349/m.273680 type:complete len:300 (+) Transcript_128349:1075-1974(+)